MRAVLWLISLPLRVVGYLAVLAACVSGFFDLWASVQDNALVFTPLGELWFRYSVDTLNLAQAAIQRGVHPVLWDPVIQFFLNLPAFIALLILAAVV
ncbi:MAG: hypothetical protein AAGJ94_12535, partial [Pseudomonadota bacterium]